MNSSSDQKHKSKYTMLCDSWHFKNDHDRKDRTFEFDFRNVLIFFRERFHFYLSIWDYDEECLDRRNFQKDHWLEINLLQET